MPRRPAEAAPATATVHPTEAARKPARGPYGVKFMADVKRRLEEAAGLTPTDNGSGLSATGVIVSGDNSDRAQAISLVGELVVAEAKQSAKQAAALAALARMQAGTYGRCVKCGVLNKKDRMDALPETPFCYEHSRG